jgi:hypothetical protein
MGMEIREGNIIEALPQRCNIDKALRRSLRHVCHCLFLSLSALQFLNSRAFACHEVVKCSPETLD